MSAPSLNAGPPEGPEPAPRPGWLAREPVAAAILLFCLAIEAAIQLGSLRDPTLRATVFAWGSFYLPYLTGAAPTLYPGQAAAMFVSYGFLHGGLLHVGVNMATLTGLAPPVTARIGQRRFLWLWLATTVGGGAGFALVTPMAGPMVGASGALFGLAGAILGWAWDDRRRAGWPRGQVLAALWKPLAYLAGFNVVMYVVLAGGLAWGAHLGGFVVGWLWAMADRGRHFAKMRS